MKAARAASWHHSRPPVTSASEEGASRRRGSLGTRDAAANPLLPSVRVRCRVFGPLAFLRLLGRSYRLRRYARAPVTASRSPRAGPADRRIPEQRLTDGIDSRDDIGSTVNHASSPRRESARVLRTTRPPGILGTLRMILAVDRSALLWRSLLKRFRRDTQVDTISYSRRSRSVSPFYSFSLS